jgi:hypothetical protein
MLPGSELDNKIATLLFRYALITNSDSGFSVYNHILKREQPVPKFSTDIDESYKIITEMTKLGYKHLMGSKYHKGEMKPYAAFFRGKEAPLFVFGQTSEHSICLAALVALTQMQQPVGSKKNKAEIIPFKPKDTK